MPDELFRNGTEASTLAKCCARFRFFRCPLFFLSTPQLLNASTSFRWSLVTSSQPFILEQHRVLDVSSLTAQERKLYEINHDLTRNHCGPMRRHCTVVPRRRSTLHRQMEAQPLQEQTRGPNDDRARRRKPLHPH